MKNKKHYRIDISLILIFGAPAVIDIISNGTITGWSFLPMLMITVTIYAGMVFSIIRRWIRLCSRRKK